MDCALLAALALTQAAPATAPAPAEVSATAGSGPAAGETAPPGAGEPAPRLTAEQAQAAYDAQYLEFQDRSQHGATRSWTLPRQGKAGSPVDGETFYRLVGREDLAGQYRGNDRKRTTIRVVGVTIAIGVPLLALATAHQKNCGPEPSVNDPNFGTVSAAYSACSASNDQARLTSYLLAGLGAGAGLAIAIVGGNSVAVHPVGAGEAQRLGEEYNKKLREQLDLEQAPRPRPRPGVEPIVALSVIPLRGGGALGLALEF